MPTWLREYKVVSTCKLRYTTMPCKDVVKKLSTCIGGLRWTPSNEARSDSKLFKEEMEQNIGAHGFTSFQVIDHGYTLSHLNTESEYKPSVRFTLGNPLMAECIQRIDTNAGLHMPTDILIEETRLRTTCHTTGEVQISTGTVVSYVLPSSLIAAEAKAFLMTGNDYNCLLHAATNLDFMLETLIEYICSPLDVLRDLWEADPPAVPRHNGSASAITMDKLEDPSLAKDWEEPSTSRSASTSTRITPRIPGEIESAKDEPPHHSSPVRDVGSLLSEHALRRHGRQEKIYTG